MRYETDRRLLLLVLETAFRWFIPLLEEATFRGQILEKEVQRPDSLLMRPASQIFQFLSTFHILILLDSIFEDAIFPFESSSFLRR